MKRLFDLMMGIVLIALLAIPMLLVAIAVGLTSKGSVLYWSDRVGRGNVIFEMPKFRSMRVDTPVVASHKITDPDAYLLPIGGFIRCFSFDELPQLFSILKGDMSFVGPRPVLCSQDDLIALRTANGVDRLIPGLTGWAQVNGRDNLSIEQKVALDIVYLQRQSFWFDLRILFITLLQVAKRVDISH